MELTNFIGKSIFSVQNEFTTKGLETLEGTSNEIWVSYSEEIDVTFHSSKSTNLITHASIGKNPL